MSLTTVLADEKIVVGLIIGFAGLLVKFVIRPAASYLRRRLKSVFRVFAELVPNGGNSMWDKIDRIDKRMQKIGDNQLTALHLVRMVASNVTKIMWTADRDGNTDWVNEHWVERTGIAADQAKGFGWLNGLHSDDREWVIDAWQAAVEHGRDFNELFRLEHDRTAVVFWVKARAHPTRDQSTDRIVGWTGVMTEAEPIISQR